MLCRLMFFLQPRDQPVAICNCLNGNVLEVSCQQLLCTAPNLDLRAHGCEAASIVLFGDAVDQVQRPLQAFVHLAQCDCLSWFAQSEAPSCPGNREQQASVHQVAQDLGQKRSRNVLPQLDFASRDVTARRLSGHIAKRADSIIDPPPDVHDRTAVEKATCARRLRNFHDARRSGPPRQNTCRGRRHRNVSNKTCVLVHVNATHGPAPVRRPPLPRHPSWGPRHARG